MNEAELFTYIGKKKKAEILDIVKNAYFEMNSEQKDAVFGCIISDKTNTKKLSQHNAQEILDDVISFYKDSMRGYYYAPFAINSKNYMDIPEETSEWCNKAGIYLDQTSQISIQGLHEIAVKSFSILFGLIDELGDRDIVFSDEIGSWMVGGDEEQAVKCYITSLAQCCSPEDFVKHLIPLLKRDSYESLSNKVFTRASSIGNKNQVSHLKEEVERLKIRVK